MPQMMNAMVLHPGTSRLVEETVPIPQPARGELLIRVGACAVCRTDLHVVDGDLPGPKLPLIPGHEVIGVVEALGDGAPAGLRGQRVGVPWLGETCGDCEYCRSGHENLCDRARFTGYTRDGGFAEYLVRITATVFRSRKAIPIPMRRR